MFSSTEINTMIKDCLFKSDEIIDGKPPDDFIAVDGLVQKFGFHPQRLEAKRNRLREIIADLDSNFLKGGGGGYTFLNLAFDKDGRKWGEQPDAEALTALCKGLGMASYCLPREMWDALPGGVPYIVFDPNGRPSAIEDNTGRAK